MKLNVICLFFLLFFRSSGVFIAVRSVTFIASDYSLVPTQINTPNGRFRRTIGRIGTSLHIIRFAIPPALSQLRTSPR